MGDSGTTEGPHDGDNLRTTHWSIVLAAGQQWSQQAHEALTILCQTYWKPVCAFIHHRGCDLENAKDLTQSFFARLIESPDLLQTADRKRGRFRSFLLTSVRNFVSNVLSREQALKRGGGVRFVPLDCDKSEMPWAEEPANNMSPEKEFDRRWAMTIIQHAMTRLQGEFVEAGKGEQFEVIQEFLPGSRNTDLSYADAATRLKSSEAAVRQAAVRLRCRLRNLLQAEVAQTVAAPADVEDELSYLLTALTG